MKKKEKKGGCCVLEGETSQAEGAVWNGGQDSELRVRRPEFCRRTLGIVTINQELCEKSCPQLAVILIPVRV